MLRVFKANRAKPCSDFHLLALNMMHAVVSPEQRNAYEERKFKLRKAMADTALIDEMPEVSDQTCTKFLCEFRQHTFWRVEFESHRISVGISSAQFLSCSCACLCALNRVTYVHETFLGLVCKSNILLEACVMTTCVRGT